MEQIYLPLEIATKKKKKSGSKAGVQILKLSEKDVLDMLRKKLEEGEKNQDGE